jgi:hypothetical protein
MTRVVSVLFVLFSGLKAPSPSHSRLAAPTKHKASAPSAPALRCTLLTTEAPRGGRLEVEGQAFGQAPLVRIAGKVTRMIERTETRIAVQIPADSDGGMVTVTSNKHQANCGTLTIIGKD